MSHYQQYLDYREKTNHRPGARCTYKGKLYEVDGWPRQTQSGDGWHVYGKTTWVVGIRPVNAATNKAWQGGIVRPVSQVNIK